MVAAQLNLDGNRIIEEGSFWQLEILYPGNIQGSYIKGDIKRSHDGDRLATFRQLPIEFDAETGKSSIAIYLTAQDTKRIPIPPDSWVYDVLLFTQGAIDSPVRLLQGLVKVSPGVTDA